MVSCFRREEDNCALPGYYAAGSGTITTILAGIRCAVSMKSEVLKFTESTQPSAHILHY
jgi:hypothetical protein